MEYMELVKELEQKLVLNQERHDCNSSVADNGEVYSFLNNINTLQILKVDFCSTVFESYWSHIF